MEIETYSFSGTASGSPHEVGGDWPAEVDSYHTVRYGRLSVFATGNVAYVDPDGGGWVRTCFHFSAGSPECPSVLYSAYEYRGPITSAARADDLYAEGHRLCVGGAAR